MFGLPRERWRSPVIHERAARGWWPHRVPGRALPVLVAVGGRLAVPDGRRGHPLLRRWAMGLLPLEDLRRSDAPLRDRGAGQLDPSRAGQPWTRCSAATSSTRHESGWKRAVHRDAGSWFDLEDVRDHYAAELFGVDIAELWRTDPERALDLGRAAVAEVLAAAVAEWRRPGSPCAGMLADRPCATCGTGRAGGWSTPSGRPKAPWYVLARGSAPVAVLITDEGSTGSTSTWSTTPCEPVDGTSWSSRSTPRPTRWKTGHPPRGGPGPRRGRGPRRRPVRRLPRPDLRLPVRSPGLRAGDRATCSAPPAPSWRRRATCPAARPAPVDTTSGLQAAGRTGRWRGVAARGLYPALRPVRPGGRAGLPAPADSWFHLPPGGASVRRSCRPEPGRPARPAAACGH